MEKESSTIRKETMIATIRAADRQFFLFCLGEISGETRRYERGTLL